MSIRVFLVDDHAMIREGLKMLLGSQKDIEVIGYAASGRTAVQKIQELKPDIVIMLLVEGKTSAEAARILNLSPKSVDTYRSRLMQKLSIFDLPGLVKFAIKQGLISMP